MTVTVFRYVNGKVRSTAAVRQKRSGKLLLADARVLGICGPAAKQPCSLKELALVGAFLTRAGAIQSAIHRYDRVTKHYEEELREVAAARGEAVRALNAEERRQSRIVKIGEAS